MKPHLTWGLLTLLFLIGAYWLNSNIIKSTLNYKNAKQKYAQYLSYENRLLDYHEWFSDAWEDKKAEARLIQKKVDKNQQQEQVYLWYLLILMLVYGIVSLILFSAKVPPLFISTLLFIALAALHLGLFAPMLEISAFEKDLTIPLKMEVLSMDFNHKQVFKGDLYFYYQSKSVMELIVVLFEQHNYVVGMAILLFSVLLPVSKIVLTLLGIFQNRLLQNPFVHFMISKTSKWSMADVFVVAVFLAFLAFNNMQTGISTESNVRIGLYFFLGYCVLSIISSMLVEKWKKLERI